MSCVSRYMLHLFSRADSNRFIIFRVHKYASCSNECFILALIYIDRLIQRNNFLLTELNVHRVVITAILLAAKFFDDAYYNNAYYAKVGGVLVSEMNGLEVDFLFRINFSLHVTPEVFEKYRAELLSHSNAPVAMPMETEQVPMRVHAQQQHQQSHFSMPQAPNPVMNTNAMQVTAAHSNALRASTQISPSPPREAAAGMVFAPPSHVHARNTSADMMMMMSAAHQQGYPVDFHHETALLPVQRTNSMPVAVKQQPSASAATYYQGGPIGSVRCSQNSLSAPPTITGQYSNVAGVDGQYVAAMQNQIYPLQNTLIHHNHGGFSQGVPNDGAYSRDSAQRLLSGAGL